MFRIRRIYDDVLPVNQQAIAEVEQILAENFPAVRREEVEQLAAKLRNPLQRPFRTILFVAERPRGQVVGFALLMQQPELGFCYLDYLAASKRISGRGIGAALYERVRDEALSLGAKGLFFECPPDQRDQCPDEMLRKHNVARLRFYERYGVRPIMGTAYQRPIKPDDKCMPYLMFDGLDRGQPLRPDFARAAVRAVLEGKYAHLCPPEYVDQVVASFAADPLPLRPPRYVKGELAHRTAGTNLANKVPVVINDKHDIHHVRERGYVQSPVRIGVLVRELSSRGLIEKVPVKEYPLRHITAVHEAGFVEYLRRACARTPEGKSVYPYVFPIRNAARPPKELSVRAGYYCIDTFTPINRNAFPAARRGVDCALTAADLVLAGRPIAYALVRPPGHHAERRAFGGFCYFNNAAVAAHYLSQYGKVAILDLDYHHGNGQQDIFYQRNDVLTVSIHGAPDFAYPYFTGFADERGEGPGEGFNVNIPLPEIQDGAQYQRALQRALRIVADFQPAFLVVALGLDPAKGDPTGTWLLVGRDFEQNGQMVGRLDLPTLVVQEGGYRTRTLGANARRFFEGLLKGSHDR